MKQQEVFNKIGGIIREINEQYDYLKTSGEAYNDLELELLVANAHFLSDHLDILRKVSAQATASQSPLTGNPAKMAQPKAEQDHFKPVKAEEPVVEPKPATGSNEHGIEFEIGNKADTIRHELSMEGIADDWDEIDELRLEAEQEHPHAGEPKPEPVAEKPAPKAPTTAEPKTQHTQIQVPEDQVITLNDRMSAQMAPGRMSDQLSGQPVTDLKKAITLNDKLLYIKELFNGYSLAYSEAIDILNKMSTFEEAESYLKTSYATKNNWDDKTLTVDKFCALLQRRYTV